VERALVTGGTGFLGSYMCELLAGLGVDVTSADCRPPRSRQSADLNRASYRYFDVTNRADVFRTLDECRPDVIFHFAGQSYIDKSWEDPARTYDVNVMGTLHLLDAVQRSRPRTSFAFAGSGTEYGRAELVPTPETAALIPGTPYASSKAAADLLCLQYFLGKAIPVYRYRIFGTTGPGKTGDACNDFASQIALAERGEIAPEIHVGNLERGRDISDVRDAVRAMLLVVERGEPGGAYNIGSGRPRDVRSILEGLIGLARVPMRSVRDERQLRPVDEPVHAGDISKIEALGFSPRIDFGQTLADLLDYWRSAAPHSPPTEGVVHPLVATPPPPPARGSV
jgi:GDP-4-dehydro-6-deoxy-D-mannose reductase